MENEKIKLGLENNYLKSFDKFKTIANSFNQKNNNVNVESIDLLKFGKGPISYDISINNQKFDDILEVDKGLIDIILANPNLSYQGTEIKKEVFFLKTRIKKKNIQSNLMLTKYMIRKIILLFTYKEDMVLLIQ